MESMALEELEERATREQRKLTFELTLVKLASPFETVISEYISPQNTSLSLSPTPLMLRKPETPTIHVVLI